MLSDHVAQFMYPKRKATIRRVRRDGGRIPAHAAAAAVPGALAPTRPSQSSEAARRGRHAGFHRLADLIIDHYHKKKTIKQGLRWHELMVRLTGPIVRELDAVFVNGAKFTAAMRAVEDDYRSKSRQVVLQDWLRRPTRERIFDNLMRLTSSLQ